MDKEILLVLIENGEKLFEKVKKNIPYGTIKYTKLKKNILLLLKILFTLLAPIFL